MVARQFAPSRAVAVATLAILLLTLLPVPTVQAQTVHNVFVTQGEAKFYQSNFAGKPTSFLDSGPLASTLSVTVQHTGSTQLENATIYWNLVGNEASSARGGCIKLTLPPTQTSGQPGNATANILIETRDLPAGPYNVTVNAFTPKPAASPQCTGAFTQAFTPGACTPGANCQTDIDNTDNTLTAYFVKDATLNLEIDEIRWCRGAIQDTCQTEMFVDGGYYNTTFQGRGTAIRPTYFEIVVKNIGTWQNLSNFGGPCACANDGFSYELNLTVSGAYIHGVQNLSTTVSTTALASQGDGTGTQHRAQSLTFNLANRAGTYNVTVRLDPQRTIRFLPGEPVDIGYRDVDVMYRDFTGNITGGDLRTDPTNPYPYDGGFTIAGNVTFRNIGTAGLRASTGAGDDEKVFYNIYIDNTTQTVFQKSGQYTATGGGSEQVILFEFGATSFGTSANYIPPGRHTLIAVIDTSNSTVELNETNNTFSVDFFIADVSVPTFNGAIKLTGGGISLPARTTFFPLESFNIFADARDDDNALKVVANFTLDSNRSVYRTVELIKQISNYAVGVPDFNFHNFSAIPINGTENWTVTVTARDSSGNNATAASVPYRLIAYPLHNASAKDIILTPTEYPEANKIPWSGTDEPSWRIRVTQNMTGYYGAPPSQQVRSLQEQQNQQNYTANLAINITTAKNRTFNENGTYWLAETGPNCMANTTQPNPVEGALNNPGCTPQQQTTTNTFTTSFGKTQDGAGPGLWNWSVRITDIAGHTRIINGTTLIEDKPPEINGISMTTGDIIPGANITVNGNFSDDDNEISAVHVNFTRVNPSDGVYVNLTLTQFEPEPGTGVTYYNYTQTFKTGRNQDFGLGGLFNATISARDLTGNWNSTSLGQIRIVDQDAPVITEYGVTPTAAEVDENITLWAKVSDATNVKVKLEIFRTATSSELLRDAIFLTEEMDGRFVATLNFTLEGTHAFRLTPIDSVNLAGQVASGTLSIRDNLGPKFEIRNPAFMIEGTRYGSGTPRIEVVVFDIEGVQASSVDMKVAGLPVDFAVLPAPGNINGFLITYDVKANKKFSHRDVVEVNLSAKDNSSEALEGSLNFSFVVDDVAPIAKLTSIAPSYRDQPLHALNISLNSRISLAAEDNDGLPTNVESIRYRILGGGPSSAETVYTGPFKIDDAPGVYQGPRLYQIQYWAEDGVGNFNRAFNTTTVFVDDTPPALYQFFPQGRSVNATFVDDRVGVNRSVVWYRENSQAYLPLPLTEKDGTWSLTLPEGQKGDTISYYLQAWDRLDNTETFGNASAPYATFRVDNREPTIKITSPIEGSRVFRTVDLTWEASDIDGDALVFTIFYKGPGESTFTELAKIENTATRRYTLDTTSNRFRDGQYTFRIAAGDGGFVKLAETTILIINSARAVGTVGLPREDILPGSTMLVTAEVTKSEALVEALILVKGEIIARHPMNDQGKDGDVTPNDGTYSVRIPVDAAGDYSIEIFTQYREDGELKSFTSEPQFFSVKLTPSYLLSTYGAIIAIIGLLAAVGIGVAVFVVVRRR